MEAVHRQPLTPQLVFPVSAFRYIFEQQRIRTQDMVAIYRLTLLVGLTFTVSALPVTKRDPEVVPGKYIVTLKPGVPVSAVKTHLNWVRDVHSRSLSRRDASGIDQIYSIKDFNGYAGSFDEATISQIRNSDDVSIHFKVVLFRPFNQLTCFPRSPQSSQT